MTKANDIIGAVAVVGGGITGIQASLDLAGMGFKVYLIEEKPAIGGIMAMLDKTFPTNDCSLCILSPKLVECGRNKDIEIMTCSSVEELEGVPGHFKLSVHKKPRYVDPEKCTSCGQCLEKCPINIPNIYEQGLSFRKAIYKYYPQAIPNSYLIDKEGLPPDYKGCIECGQCEKSCEVGAIDLSEKPEDMELEVGAVIFTEGAPAFNPVIKPEFGYGRYINVMTSQEYERILSASGPYDGKIQRPGDRKHPDKIAWIQCVGSRDRQIGKNYCSSVCCMYSTKEAIITKEHAPDTDTTIFYIDMRAHGKDCDKYVDRAEKVHHVNYIRSRVSEVVEDPETDDLIIRYEDDMGNLKEDRFGMVVLSVGLAPKEKQAEQLKKLGIEVNDYGFAKADYFHPVETNREGVFIAGSIQEPMAIPEAVMQASAAACRAASVLRASRGTMITEKEYPPERDVSGEEPRIGVFVCHCGTNIAGYLDVEKLTGFAAGLENVIHASSPVYTCAQDTQKMIADIIRDENLNRVVVAACSPRTHEALFQETLKSSGLNPYLFEMANIRDQCSWIHMEHPEEATRKAMDLIAMSISKARLLEPLPIREVPVTPKALVIGGGIAGITSAISLADEGYETLLVEQDDILGGRLNRISYTLDGRNVSGFLADLVERMKNHERIEVLTGAKINSVKGYVGNFETEIETGNGARVFEHGVIMVTTGAEECSGEEYLYGKDSRVLSQHDLEEKLSDMREGDLPEGETYVMIQCVGSRNDERPWCSRVCCAQAVKNALRIKEINPRAEVCVLYRDMRTYGFKEEFYEKARDQGVIFLRYDPEKPPEIEPEENRLMVKFEEQFMREEVKIPAHYLVVSLGLEPASGRERLAGMLKIPLNEDGFFLEAHVKLRPVDFATEGIFVAGTCHTPKFIDETIYQSQAAAGRAANILANDTYRSTAVTAKSDPDICSGCGVCISVCDYSAVSLVKDMKEGKEIIRSEVNESLCKGCGCCVSACPAGAMEQRGFTTRQLREMLRAGLQTL